MDANTEAFAGALGKDYDFIKLICPNVPQLHRSIASLVQQQRAWPGHALTVLELGCGTGLLTVRLLEADAEWVVQAVDCEPVMLRQAHANLARFVAGGRLTLSPSDALSYLRTLQSAGIDAVVSAYCLHNFDSDYRRSALVEIFRVLRPGGLFVNGDRYALDNIDEHCRTVQREIRHYFQTFRELSRIDLLEEWIVHLLGDESPSRIMRKTDSEQSLREIGFEQVQWHFQKGVDHLLSAVRPVQGC